MESSEDKVSNDEKSRKSSYISDMNMDTFTNTDTIMDTFTSTDTTIDSFSNTDTSMNSFSTTTTDMDKYLNTDMDKEERRASWFDLSTKINDIEETTDVISKPESEHRLNILLSGLALILLSFAITFTFLCFQINAPVIIEYEYPMKKMTHGTPHLMMITKEGQMVPYAWKSNQQSNMTYPNLWKKRKIDFNVTDFTINEIFNDFLGYFYKNQIFVLYPVSNQKIVVIEKNGTHRMLGSTSTYPQLKNSIIAPNGVIHGLNLVHLNNFVWVLGGYSDVFGQRETASITRLWSTKKQHWFKGPSMPSSFYIFYGCIVAVNRTMVFLIGGSESDDCDFLTANICKNR